MGGSADGAILQREHRPGDHSRAALPVPRQEKHFDFPLGTWNETNRITVLTFPKDKLTFERCSSSMQLSFLPSGFVFKQAQLMEAWCTPGSCQE
jgi:hypothetical protein